MMLTALTCAQTENVKSSITMQLQPQPTAKIRIATKKEKRKNFNEDAIFVRKTADCPGSIRLRLIPGNYQQRRLIANSVHRQATRYALLNSLLTVIVITCAYLGNEAEYSGHFTSVQSSALRVLIIAVSAVQIFLTIQSAKLQLELMKLSGDMDRYSSI